MARVARLQNTKIPLIDEKGKLLTFRSRPAIIKSKGSVKQISNKKVEFKRKDSDMEKTIKAQKFAALVVLASGCIFGITQYTNDVAVIVGGILLVALLLEKAK